MNKRVAVILGTMILILGALFSFLALTIVNSKDCSQVVIDTNELHSGIDIPEVEYINCYYDSEKKIRVSIYKLRLNEYYLHDYIEQNEFTLSQAAFDFGIEELPASEQPMTDQVYEVNGITWGNEWTYVVERATGRLWVQIVYD